jgi:hypothetical protein
MPQKMYIQLMDKLVPIDVAILFGLLSLTACAWLIPMILGRLIPMILGRIKWSIRGWISRARRKEQGKSNFLQLPPELRLQVYSHLPLPASHAMRQTNRQINDEIKYEQCKEFERQLRKAQTGLSDSMELRHSTPIKPFEVNLMIRIVSNVDSPYEVAKAFEKYLRNLPITTRSINIAIESARDVPGREVNTWFYITTDALWYHLFRAQKVVRTGRMRLRSYRVVCPGTTDFGLYKLTMTPPWVTTVGMAGMIDKAGNRWYSDIQRGFPWLGSACIVPFFLELLITSAWFRGFIIVLWIVCLVFMVAFWTVKWLVWIVKSLTRNLVNWFQDLNT